MVGGGELVANFAEAMTEKGFKRVIRAKEVVVKVNKERANK